MKRKISLLLLCMLTMAVSAQKNYKFEVDTLRWAGDKCINIVFLGDGYVESELGTFKMDAAKQMNSFLKQDPYKRYSKYFNFVCIPTPSNENGAGLTPDKPKDTMYKVCFGTSGVDRMPWPTDWTAVNKVLSTNFPSYDMVAIITDTTKYGGGGGGKFICYTKNESSIQTLYHESGHSFGSLADEYWYAGREAANMTRTKDPEKIKWKNWLGYQQVGIYPFYGTNEDSNYVRPHQNCLMRYLGKPFCAVCKEALVERVHNIVNPIREQDPKLRVPSINDSTITLKITTLKPTPNTLKTIWTFRGDTIASKVDSVKIITDDLPNGTYTAVVSVEDTTLLQRVDNHTKLHAKTVTWRLKREVTGITATSVQNGYAIAPSPFTTRLTVTREKATGMPLRVELVSLSGQVCAKAKSGGSNSCTLNTSNLPNGVYVARIYDGKDLVLTRKVLKK